MLFFFTFYFGPIGVRNKGQEVLLTDTVGFISKLPTDLIAAFRFALLCCVMIPYMLRYDMICYVMSCCAMLQYGLSCHIILCDVMSFILCYIMLCCAILCYVMLWCNISCFFIFCYALLSNVMLCYVIQCTIEPCYLILF